MVKNRVKVSICDTPYSLVGDEDESHVFHAAAYVDSAMRSVIEAGIAEREKAAVLVALQLASKALKSEEYEQSHGAEVKRILEKIEREMRLLVGTR